jgi:hypothetical protein
MSIANKNRHPNDGMPLDHDGYRWPKDNSAFLPAEIIAWLRRFLLAFM